jgi:3-mercaptopyruvate sulfurtransferase SseA
MDPENVYVLLGGFGGWQAAGYPTESGSGSLYRRSENELDKGA